MIVKYAAKVMLFFEICKVFNIESDVLKDIPLTEEETEIFKKREILYNYHRAKEEINLIYRK